MSGYPTWRWTTGGRRERRGGSTALITVFPSPDGWRVCFYDDAEMLTLFGTDMPPSGFTRWAEPETVFQDLKHGLRHRIRLIRGEGGTVRTYE